MHLVQRNRLFSLLISYEKLKQSICGPNNNAPIPPNFKRNYHLNLRIWHSKFLVKCHLSSNWIVLMVYVVVPGGSGGGFTSSLLSYGIILKTLQGTAPGFSILKSSWRAVASTELYYFWFLLRLITHMKFVQTTSPYGMSSVQVTVQITGAAVCCCCWYGTVSVLFWKFAFSISSSSAATTV